MWLFGSLWHRWTLPFKIVTPLLHILFAAAQLWGSYVFWRLWQREKARVAGLDAADVEMGREGHGGEESPPGTAAEKTVSVQNSERKLAEETEKRVL
jgi:hypothetical protein